MVAGEILASVHLAFAGSKRFKIFWIFWLILVKAKK